MSLACSIGVNASPVEEVNAELVQENGWQETPTSFEHVAKVKLQNSCS